MKRLCYLLLFCLPLWLQAQAPLQVGISTREWPYAAAYVPGWGYMLTTAGGCTAYLHWLDEAGQEKHKINLQALNGMAFVPQGDTLWIYGPLLQDDVPFRVVSYRAIDREGNLIVNENIDISHLGWPVFKSSEYHSFFSALRQDSLLYDFEFGNLYKVNTKTHQLLAHFSVNEYNGSLALWQDSLLLSTSEGLYVLDTALQIKRQITSAVYDHIVHHNGQLYARAGTSIYELNDTLGIAKHQAMDGLLSQIHSWAWHAQEVCLLGTDLAGDTVLVVLDARSLSPRRWLYMPLSGTWQVLGQTGSWGVAGNFPGLGLLVSDSLGRWELPKQRVAVVAHKSRLTWAQFDRVVSGYGGLWHLHFYLDISIKNLGPDTLRYLDIFGAQTYGMNCVYGYAYTQIKDTAIAPGDTLFTEIYISSVITAFEGQPKQIPLEVLLRNPNHELSPTSAITEFTGYYQYTARDAAHSLLAQVTAYPNPTTDLLRLTLPPSLPAVAYTVQDLQGRTLATGQARTGTALPTAQLAPGLYVLRLHTPEGAAHSLRFMKQ